MSHDTANIQFLTEYNAKHSIYIELDKARFPVPVETGETPDLLILINGPSPVIVSIEAKMYDMVSTGDLLEQLRAQRENVLELLARGIPGARLEQVALVPSQMSINANEIGEKVRLVRWEQIVEGFADVASASYFCGVLDLALKNYKELHSKKLIFHANMQKKMTGDAILKGFGEETFVFRTMGRSGGSTGRVLADDLASGGWRQQLYELNSQETPTNANWFTIEDFVARVRQTDGLTDIC